VQLTRRGARRTEMMDGDDDLWAWGGLLVQGWDVTSLVLRIHDLEEHASRDSLTGLANRLTFTARLNEDIARSHRSGRNIAVLFADIDDFKRVNDTFGHEAGDQVLVALGERLTRVLRPGDTVARLGGDEFAIICPNLFGREHARAIVDRVRAAAAITALIGTHQIGVCLSIGLAFATDSAHEDGGARVLRQADQAMYQEKLTVIGDRTRGGGGTFRRLAVEAPAQERRIDAAPAGWGPT
jgi:diguanylate cyclase (GGDEF)-like protein